ncbi:MAG: hypothetical protein N2383_09125, partial [Caldilineales bacterium]|nr:hypothetical protein [Caldilineales bacterium]
MRGNVLTGRRPELPHGAPVGANAGRCESMRGAEPERDAKRHGSTRCVAPQAAGIATRGQRGG